MSMTNIVESKEQMVPRMESNSAPLVRLRGVTKNFKRGSEKLEVLKHLDLDVPRGDFLALMGPSGSGKTTLLNILGGIDRPTSGEVLIDGNSLQRMNEGALTRWRARHVGFVFQLYHLLPALTAEENVALPLILTQLNTAERKRRARAALALVGLEDRGRHKPGELSGGQEQRVGIARAIVTDPTILLCDEPTGDLDRKAGDEILHLLHLLNREHGKTIVMVTHDPRAAARAQHTLFMDKGVLSEEPEVVQ
ncbi:MAG TPA: ABC transporter ATP-binding protein [Rhizomicrobium sp.]|jgi:putative ABC transport system ATP-binding protein|nr:ABC transporter ATP-binding protein [Rhizomicrobium sp.]